jgi:hypothetical protein
LETGTLDDCYECREGDKASLPDFVPPDNLHLTQRTETQQNQPMKIIITRSNIILIFAAAAAALFVGGCAEMEATNTKSLLSAAGFQVRTPETARQKEIYAVLPPYKVERGTVNGKTFYVFKDEKAGVAYVGREPQYQRYKQLAIQQQIAQDYYMAAELEQQAAWRWYGAWGPGVIWR